MDKKNISVGLGDLFVSKDPGTVFIAHGLGSCIGVSAYDQINKIGGMVHVLLPDSKIKAGEAAEKPGKFADTAIPALIKQLQDIGADINKLQIKIAGGSQMFAIANLNSSLNIGYKNIEAVKTAINSCGLKIYNEDTGGNAGRTLKLMIENGQVFLRATGCSEKEF